MAPKLYRSARASAWPWPAVSSGAVYSVPRTGASGGSGSGSRSDRSASRAWPSGDTTMMSGRMPSRMTLCWWRRVQRLGDLRQPAEALLGAGRRGRPRRPTERGPAGTSSMRYSQLSSMKEATTRGRPGCSSVWQQVQLPGDARPARPGRQDLGADERRWTGSRRSPAGVSSSSPFASAGVLGLGRPAPARRGRPAAAAAGGRSTPAPAASRRGRGRGSAARPGVRSPWPRPRSGLAAGRPARRGGGGGRPRPRRSARPGRNNSRNRHSTDSCRRAATGRRDRGSPRRAGGGRHGAATATRRGARRPSGHGDRPRRRRFARPQARAAGSSVGGFVGRVHGCTMPSGGQQFVRGRRRRVDGSREAPCHRGRLPASGTVNGDDCHSEYSSGCPCGCSCRSGGRAASGRSAARRTCRSTARAPCSSC